MSLSKSIKCISYAPASQLKTVLDMVRRGWIKNAIELKCRNHKQVSPIRSIQRVQFSRAKQTDLPDELKREFDIAISTAEFFCNNVVAMKIKAKKKVAWIHPDYKALNVDVEFDREVLDKFDLIAVVSKSNQLHVSEMMPDIKEKVVYIPNLLNFNEIKKLSKKEPSEYYVKQGLRVVTVCRLDNSSKRLDRIVEICRCLKEKGVNFQWYIIGSGDDEKMIRRLIIENKIENCLFLLGGRENPYPYIKYADVFVMTSQYEGRPIAVDEALFLRCPVIVTNYSSAVEQVDLRWGAIVENTDEKCIDEIVRLLDSHKIVQWKEQIVNCDLENDITKEFQNRISKYIF